MNVSVTKIKLDTTVQPIQLTTFVEPVALTVTQGPVEALAAHTIPLTAASSLSALRCVTTNASGLAEYADPSTLGSRSVVGVTLNAGTVVDAQYSGPMTDSSWNWSQGHVWCGANGTLTQTPPTSGALCMVGRVINPTTILVELEPTIRRN